jgi:hypothetical protein
MKAPKLEHAQLSENDVRGEALRPSRRDLVPPPQKVPYPLPDVVFEWSSPLVFDREGGELHVGREIAGDSQRHRRK